MSYIRALSNPEGLYVYGTDKTSLVWNGKKAYTFNHSRFKQFLSYLDRNYKDYGKWGEFELKEEKRQIPLSKKSQTLFKNLGISTTHQTLWKDCLYYKGELVSEMWHVTWMYVKRNMQSRKK